MTDFWKNIGPGAIVTAAFIGPGTITVCLLSGNKYQYALLWALLFAGLATLVLQGMSARLGLISGQGLGEAIRNHIDIPVLRKMSFTLVFTGIIVGNIAYEAGNISGTLIGLKMITPPFLTIPDFCYTSFVYLTAMGLLYLGSFKSLERFFISIVILMSLAFIYAALISRAPIVHVLEGLLSPEIPPGSIMSVVALVGTTVVPYNLFLHASMVNQKWQGKQHLKAVSRDVIFSIVIGTVISICIVITGGSTFGINMTNINDLSASFDTLFGLTGKYVFGFGIFAAGVTSTITAPLAAALVAKGIFGWQEDLKFWKFRCIWALVLTAGYIFASVGYKPIEIIKLAQFVNGLLLPSIAVFLIWIVNQRKIMGEYVNNKWQNGLGIIVVLISILLGAKSIFTLF